jgi:hypothetical protein
MPFSIQPGYRNWQGCQASASYESSWCFSCLEEGHSPNFVSLFFPFLATIATAEVAVIAKWIPSLHFYIIFPVMIPLPLSSFMENKWLLSANLMVTVFKFTKMGKRFISSQGIRIGCDLLLVYSSWTSWFLFVCFNFLFIITVSFILLDSLYSCISGAFLITLNTHLGCQRLLRKISWLTGSISVF